MRRQMGNILIVIGTLLFVISVIGGLRELSCLGESPGTMIVVGGNSMRC